jgi:DNA repair protein RadC
MDQTLMRIADLAPEQRPRERLLAGQGEGLSDADLLALLWGSGLRGLSAVELAQTMLGQCGGLSGLLGLGLSDWASFPGIGPAKASQLWAALELSRRSTRAL